MRVHLFIVQRGSLGPILGLVLLILFDYFSITIFRKTEKTEPLDRAVGNTTVVGLKFIVSLAIISARHTGLKEETLRDGSWKSAWKLHNQHY